MARMRGVLIVVVLIVVAGLIGGCSYNNSRHRKKPSRAQWAQVENQLQRRSDLIPNLVETVKGLAQQESDVFQAVADARAKMAGAQTPSDKIEAANRSRPRSIGCSWWSKTIRSSSPTPTSPADG